MARVTVEDCAQVVPSRFELVALAAQRARNISSGGELTVERDNDKDAVIALREIAEGTVDPNILRDVIIHNAQEKVSLDEYGVEDPDSEATDVGLEARDEISAMQTTADSGSDNELLYGDDNLETVED